QNVIDSRTVFQRRWGVATVVADTAGTSSLTGNDAAAVDFEIDDVEALKETLTERLATAVAERRGERADSFEWIDDEERGENAERGGNEGVEGDGRNETTGDDRAGGGASVEDVVADAEADDATTGGPSEEDLEIPADGVVRPDFSPSDRDYSEPAERIDTGEYAVDQNPSDAEVAHGPRSDEAGDADETGDDRTRDAAEDDRESADAADGDPANDDDPERDDTDPRP
ncbi:MAG: hypothetical protein ACOCPY_04480, partial [Halorubrum sp.]